MLRTRLGSFIMLLMVAVLGASTKWHSGADAAATESAHVTAGSQLAAGRYLVVVGGCNDCHTPGWAESGGNVPQARWLTGSSVGFRGPWGTSYPVNLRQRVARLSEAEWMRLTRTRMRPPMPWFVFTRMSDRDRRAIYAFIKSLGPAGAAAPEALPPGRAPRTPVIDFVPIAPRAAPSR